MKINWGTGIAVFYSCFVLIFIGIVIKSKQYDLNMVKKDYYADDLAYQKHFDKKQNALNLGDKAFEIDYDQSKGYLTLAFKQGASVKGKVTLFHPARDKDDKIFIIQTDSNGIMTIPLSNELSGLWRIQVDWSAEGVDFYKEETIVL